MTFMAFPESLRKDFDALESHPSGMILTGYHVRERRPGGREFMLRLLPDSFCRDKGLVESFHEFCARFASISNKSYTPQVYSVTGAVNGPVYVLEEYVAGISLTEFVKKKGISSDFNREVIEILSKVCEALHHAHQKDIYHLCINPEDIIVDELTGKVKLVGFGAQIFAEVDKTGLLPEEAKKHIPPQVLAGKSFGPTADIYSLGVAINGVWPDIFANNGVLSKALSDNPSERYQTARDFERALNDVLEDISKLAQSRNIDTPMEARGGLKPVLSQKATTKKLDSSDCQARKIHTPPSQPHISTDSVPPKSISMKLVVGIAVGLIAVVIGSVLYVSHERQRLEKQRAEQKRLEETIRLREIAIQAAIDQRKQEQLKKEEDDRLANEAKEREIKRLKAELDQKQREKEEQEQLRKQERDRQKQQKKQWEQQERERQERERIERERKIEQERQRRDQEKQNAFLQKLNQLVRSIEKGSSPARQEIKDLCRNPETMEMIRTAANNGNADAQFMLGRAYHMGDGASIDYNMAIYWYTKSAEHQNAAAECNLGYMYHEGKGVPSDRSKARYWFTRAAQHGDTDAERMLRNKYGD